MTSAKNRVKPTSGRGFEDSPTGSAVTEGDKKGDEGDEIFTLGDKEVVTIAWVAEKLGVQPNTIVRRYLPEKVLPAFDGLDCPPLRGQNGRLTGFGAKAIAQYVWQCVRGDRQYSDWREEVRITYQSEVVTAELVDDEIPSATSSLAILGESQEGLSDTTQSMLAELLFQRQQLATSASQLEALRKKEMEERAMQEAIAQEIQQTQEQQARLDAIIKAKALLQQQ